jgi:hypothetical protein
LGIRRTLSAVFWLLPLVAQAQGVLRLKTRLVVPEVSGSPGRRRLPVRSQHMILQFAGAPDAAVVSDLAKRNVTVLGYVPDNALSVTISPVSSLEGLDYTWFGAIEPTDKISTSLDGSSTFLVAVFYSDVSVRTALAVVGEGGFSVVPRIGMVSGQYLISGSPDRLIELAQADEVAYLMPASDALVAGSVGVACAGAITEVGPIAEYALVGSGWSKNGSSSLALNYSYRSLTNRVDSATVRAEVLRALLEWTKYSPVYFTETTLASAKRSIDILFASKAHGDGYPFDGAGGVLAHTFYPAPPNSEPIAGDMHLDADEIWNVGADTDIFSVALHEAGHALGLAHSDNPNSVMYPYYHRVTGLKADDIAGIQALYGSGSGGSGSSGSGSGTGGADSGSGSGSGGGSGTSGGRSDTTAPSLRISSPALTIVSTTASSIPVSGTAADNVGVVSVRWSTSNGDSGAATGTTVWTAKVPLLVGSNTITVRVYDAAGNSNWRALTVVRR